MAKKVTKTAETTGKDKLTPFEQIIKNYLDKMAAEDELFAKQYAKQHKTIKKCCSFIYGEMRKKAQNNVTAASDDEVYGLAVHYYEEDNLPIDKQTDKEVAKTNSTVKVEAAPVDEPVEVEIPTFDFDLF